MDLVTSAAGKRKGKDKLSSKDDLGHCHCTYKQFRGDSDSTTTNYQFAEDIIDTRAPFEFVLDYGSADLDQTLTPSQIFRMGQLFLARKNFTLKNIWGYTTNNDTTLHTITICKVTPTVGAAASLTPTEVWSKSFTGLGANTKLIQIDETSFTDSHIAKGDMVFVMVKCAEAGDVIIFDMWLEME